MAAGLGVGVLGLAVDPVLGAIVWFVAGWNVGTAIGVEPEPSGKAKGVGEDFKNGTIFCRFILIILKFGSEALNEM